MILKLQNLSDFFKLHFLSNLHRYQNVSKALLILRFWIRISFGNIALEEMLKKKGSTIDWKLDGKDSTADYCAKIYQYSLPLFAQKLSHNNIVSHLKCFTRNKFIKIHNTSLRIFRIFWQNIFSHGKHPPCWAEKQKILLEIELRECLRFDFGMQYICVHKNAYFEIFYGIFCAVFVFAWGFFFALTFSVSPRHETPSEMLEKSIQNLKISDRENFRQKAGEVITGMLQARLDGGKKSMDINQNRVPSTNGYHQDSPKDSPCPYSTDESDKTSPASNGHESSSGESLPDDVVRYRSKTNKNLKPELISHARDRRSYIEKETLTTPEDSLDQQNHFNTEEIANNLENGMHPVCCVCDKKIVRWAFILGGEGLSHRPLKRPHFTSSNRTFINPSSTTPRASKYR